MQSMQMDLLYSNKRIFVWIHLFLLLMFVYYFQVNDL